MAWHNVGAEVHDELWTVNRLPTLRIDAYRNHSIFLSADLLKRF